MQSTLIRFTSSSFVDSYLQGNLYLSSMSSFWDYTLGKIRTNKPVTRKEIDEATSGIHNERQDFSEGVIAQIPRDKLPDLDKELQNCIIHDIRFRLNAYKYCNLMCFFRIDAEDTVKGRLDEDNLSLLLKDKGHNIPAKKIRALNNSAELWKLVDCVIEKNPLLSTNMTHMVQLPSANMDKFGDVVIVIKDEDEFIRRVISAIRNRGEHCIIGDVRYHNLVDRVDPNTMNMHSITMISSNAPSVHNGGFQLPDRGTFDLSLLDGTDGIIWRGCLDKYSIYASQREWRICWLPNDRNYEAKILSVGSLDDIIDIVNTKDIRQYLLKKYRGYVPGIIDSVRSKINGTESYRDFQEYIKRIDGTGDLIFEIGG